MYKAIVFDLDGVLIDSLEVTRRAFCAAYREVGCEGDPPFDEYRRHLGRYLTDILDEMKLPRAMEEPFVQESARLSSIVQVFDGIPELLKRLQRAEIGLAVATGKAKGRAVAILENLDLASAFDVVIGGDEVRQAKPAPEIVQRALGSLGVGPLDAFMVGDSPLDLRASHAAGVQAAAALWGDGKPDELLAEMPEFVLEKPIDVMNVVLVGGV